jgi:UDP-glucose 4-epimerase
VIVWVIGAGGLLGSAVVRAARGRGDTVLVSSNIPWSDSAGTVDSIRASARQLMELISSDPSRGWGIIWAAGHATTASDERQLVSELATFRSCLEAINVELRGTRGGVFALASSAGGVYAGSENPPFSSETEPCPLGGYGWLKLQQETAARELLDPTMRVLIARIANLYGPGQDLSKLQGLISRLALTSVTKEPLTMFVPLDTLRDYISADDAAARLLHWISVDNRPLTIRVVASGEATSLGYLINLTKDIARTATPIAYGMHASAAHQSHDLRLSPDTDEYLRSLVKTPLPAGIKDVYLDILQRCAYGMRGTSRTAP